MQKHGYTALRSLSCSKAAFVGVEALGLLGAEIAAHLGALVPIEAEPAQSAQNDLRVFLGGALGIGVLDAQHERAARGAQTPSCK